MKKGTKRGSALATTSRTRQELSETASDRNGRISVALKRENEDEGGPRADDLEVIEDRDGDEEEEEDIEEVGEAGEGKRRAN